MLAKIKQLLNIPPLLTILAHEMQILAQQIEKFMTRNSEPLQHGSVLILGTTTQNLPFCFSKTVLLARGVQQTITIQPHSNITSHAWVVAVGPCTLKAVRYGNQEANVFDKLDGPVCLIPDSVSIGSLVTILLEPWS